MTNWEHISALMGEIPDLPGALCKGRADLYERTIAVYRVAGRPTKAELDAARAAALRICAACPALAPCRTWLDQQRPTRRPLGVVAGQIITATGHPAKSAPVNR